MTLRSAPYLAVMLAIVSVTAGGSLLGATATVSATAAVAPGWTDGACEDNVGVTIVVDFQELGGGVNVRCAQGAPDSGLDALDLADVAWEGTLRFPSFVCRIAGLPSVDDEPCGNTPPATAFWTYWVAPRGGDWCYSNFGPVSRTPPPGSIEGWSFALERAASDLPPPRFDVPDVIEGETPNPLTGGTCASAPVTEAPATTTTPATTTRSTTTTSTSTTSTTTSTTVAPADNSTTVVQTPTTSAAPDAATTDATTSQDSDPATTDIVRTTTTETLASTDVSTPVGSTEPSDSVSAPPDGDVATGRETFGEAAAVEPGVAPDEVGTVDLSADGRDGGGGLGVAALSSILAVVAVGGVALLVALRRNRSLRVET